MQKLYCIAICNKKQLTENSNTAEIRMCCLTTILIMRVAYDRWNSCSQYSRRWLGNRLNLWAKIRTREVKTNAWIKVMSDRISILSFDDKNCFLESNSLTSTLYIDGRSRDTALFGCSPSFISCMQSVSSIMTSFYIHASDIVGHSEYRYVTTKFISLFWGIA